MDDRSFWLIPRRQSASLKANVRELERLSGFAPQRLSAVTPRAMETAKQLDGAAVSAIDADGVLYEKRKNFITRCLK